MSREISSRTYPDPHHPLLHHQNDATKIAKLARINTFHVSLFAYFLGLQTTEGGGDSLLDQVLASYSCGIS